MYVTRVSLIFQLYEERWTLTALLLFIIVMPLTVTSAVAIDHLSPTIFRSLESRTILLGFADIFREILPGIASGFLGVFIGWLAWWGATEPLPETGPQLEYVETEAVALVDCGICNGPVEAGVRMECPYNCGQFFHTGCYQAAVAVHRGDKLFCPTCNVR